MELHENEIAGIVVDASIRVHRTLGPGLLESVCETALAHELRKRGLAVERQIPIDIRYDDLVMPGAFRADMIVNGRVLIELKSLEHVAPVHRRQTLTYVRLMDLRLGLLINFGGELLKHGIWRCANGLNP